MANESSENSSSKVAFPIGKKEIISLDIFRKSNRESYASVVPFSALVDLFERITKISKQEQKKRLLQTFFSHYHDDDFFPLMRILLPQADKERQTFGMKESLIGKLYVEILGISPTGEDAQRLMHWKKPFASRVTTATSKQHPFGDFGNAVYLLLRTRTVGAGDLSIVELNSYLDQLNVATERKERLNVLKGMLRRTTALEQKWIVRIILKDLKIGISEKFVLSYFHPDALELFNATSNLRTVCQQLKNPTINLSSISIGSISLFHPVKPMLASRHPPEEVLKFMENSPFIIERKIDGERIQVHKNDREIRIFTRNANDVTNLYGDQMISVIQEQVQVARCILDGELVIWDSLRERFEEFGKLKTFATFSRSSGKCPTRDDSKYLWGNHLGKHLCYIT